ncbi:hypothetical protein PspLS_11762 [Pyricularia sp. CBS 133598]|nr:hypothetical protein PspLS_11762 [Pyricularia sp. CBS 133598]
MHFISFLLCLLIVGTMALPAPDPMPGRKDEKEVQNRKGGKAKGAPPAQGLVQPPPYHELPEAQWREYPGYVPTGVVPQPHHDLVDNETKFEKDMDTYVWDGQPGTRRHH